MGPFDILLEEHRVIERVLGSLEKMADSFEARKEIDAQPAKEALEFFRGFADRCHHGKEEARLFALLETKDRFPKGCGPTAVLRAEHDLGRVHVRSMGEAIEDARDGRAVAVERFVRPARAYAAMLREHIQKEDSCLFPNANLELSKEEAQALGKAFEKADRGEKGKEACEKLLELAESLEKRFGPPTKSKGICSCHRGGR